MPYFGASLTDDANSVIYYDNMFMIQGTGHIDTTLNIGFLNFMDKLSFSRITLVQ